MRLPDVNTCMWDAVRRGRFTQPEPDIHTPPPTWADLRDHDRKDFPRGRHKGHRPWKQITGIGWHTTASGHLRPGHRLLPNISAHAIVHWPRGEVTLLHHATAYVNHGHDINRFTIGIEIDCRVDGVDGDTATFWRSKQEIAAGVQRETLLRPLTDAMVESALGLVAYYIREAEENGGDLRESWAHRQGFAEKAGDPGSAIWKRIVLQAESEFGLQTQPLARVGRGGPIPDVWSGQKLGVAY